MTKKEIKLIIFDVDGVLINSKENMRLSFKKMCKDNKIYNIEFKDYFKQIGAPFKNIMNSLGVKKNISKLKKNYFTNSLYFKNKIKPYKDVEITLEKLQKNFIIAIVTSKIKKNTINFLKYFFPKVKFKLICSPTNKIKSKPQPDMLLHVLKKLKIKPAHSVYVGDTYIDYVASKKSKMKFILAKYGFLANDKKIKTIFKIKKFSDILKII